MRFALVVLLLASCGTPVLVCAPHDVTCRDVDRAVAMRRRNIGGWCGTPNHVAHSILVGAGPAAVPYLLAFFDDPDPEVAVLAMHASIQLGAIDPVIDWCATVRDRVRIEMCRYALR